MPRPDKFISQPEGYIEPNTSGSFDYVYQYKDHLGNVRLSYSDTNKDGFVSSPNGNIVFSDDLENSSGWDSEGAKYGWSVPIDTGKGHLDNYSVKLHRTVTGGFYAHSNEWISIDNSEPTTYKFSGWVYAQGSGYSWARLIFFMNEDTETDYFTEISSTSRVYTKNQWVYLEQEVTVPVNIDKINLRVGLYNNSPSVTAWFDELRIEKIEETEINEIVEENNYYPFGLKHKGYNNVINGTENDFHTYNGKEHEKSLGLNWHDYGARRYDASLGRWLSTDPYAEKYETYSPYTYVANNPVNAIDPDGRLIIYVNGLLFKQALGHKILSRSGGEFVGHYAYPPPRNFQRGGITMFEQSVPYWGGEGGTRDIINDHFGDYNNRFVNATDDFSSQASDRFAQGQASGLELIAQLQNGTIELENEETIKVVGHSQGAAFAAGLLTTLADSEYASRVELGLYLSPHQPGGFEHPEGIFGAQFSTRSDKVSSKGGLLGKFLQAFNGQSELSEIEGADFLFFRPSNDSSLGGHEVNTWESILQRISNFLNDDDE
ncbi:MAG: Uncharacterised protein [Formosa sp. Hel1_33_131]|nr:MAG: Uncharacterised protein [Formosa sp. Hel1_33_131]|tara:strand:+ start:156 stop:1793 length:1638 start_codon:yes stop_codon:yes gene_type:complete